MNNRFWDELYSYLSLKWIPSCLLWEPISVFSNGVGKQDQGQTEMNQ